MIIRLMYMIYTALLVLLTGCNTLNGTKGITPLQAPQQIDTNKQSGPEQTVESTRKVVTRGIGNSQHYAVQNAVNNALESVVATLVSALNKYTGDSSIDEEMKDELTKQVLLSTSDLTKKVTIITPWSESSKSVVVETVVSTSALLRNNIIRDLLKQKLGFPKFAVLVKGGTKTAKSDLAATDMIIQRFSKYGFEFVPGTITASYIGLVGKVETTGLAKTIYTKTGARYVIIGKLNNGIITRSNNGVSTIVSLTVEVIDGKNKALLTSISESQTGTGHSEFSAKQSGLKKVLDIAFSKNKVECDIYNIWLDSLSRFEKKFEDEF